MLIKRAIKTYEIASTPLPLADCEICEITELISYDNDFDQFEQIIWIKP